jgi:trimeric autotransporter adhesin
MKVFIAIWACLFWTQMCLNCLAQPGIIRTYAGPSLPTDGALAITQAIDSPIAITIDGSGGFYVSSRIFNNVYHIAKDRRIRLVAGNGFPGYGGDGGRAALAQLNYPGGLAFDSAGNLYIADTYNNRIRKVNRAGIITTIAGNGIAGFGGDGNQATLAQLSYPMGLAVDSAGNLYLCDVSNNRIRKIALTGVITTVAGDGGECYSGDGSQASSASLDNPTGIAVDGKGNLYIADTWNHRIRKVNKAGIITTVAGDGEEGYSGDGGLAASARIRFPGGLAMDSANNLYIADNGNNRIRRVDSSGTITTVAGNAANHKLGDDEQAEAAMLKEPTGLAIDHSGNLYIADCDNNRIRKVNPTGIITTVAGNGTFGYKGDGGPATSALLNIPSRVALDSTGNLYVVDSQNYRIRKINPNGEITTIAGNGTSGYNGDGGPATLAQFGWPTSVAVDSAGNLYIADAINNLIRKVTSFGEITTIAGNRGALSTRASLNSMATRMLISSPRDVAVDSSGNVYIVGGFDHCIFKVTPDGGITVFAGQLGKAGYKGDGSTADLAQLNYPSSITMDSAGNLFISDTGNSRIRKVSAKGVITTVAGNGNKGYAGDGDKAISALLSDPRAIAADTVGNLYIADYGNHCIRKVDSSGIITTVAGRNKAGFGYGYSIEGAAATSVQLNIDGLAVDSAGNLYFTDSGSHRVRRILASK